MRFKIPRKNLIEGGFEELVAGGGGGDPCFQFIAKRHQFVHFRHDPLLFCEGWERDENLVKNSEIDIFLGSCRGELEQIGLRRPHEILKVTCVRKYRSRDKPDDAVWKARIEA